MKGIKIDGRQLTKALIITGTVLIIIYLINSMTTGKEKSATGFFTTPSSATNQKIMTVNQSTGEINFVNKSVQSINDELVTDLVEIKDALKLLLGNNLDGKNIPIRFEADSTDGMLAKLGKRIEAVDTALDARISANATAVAGKQAASSNIIHSGDLIAIAHKGDNGCGGNKGCRAMTNFKRQDSGNIGAALDSGWRKADLHFGHGSGSDIKIHKV